MASDNSISIDYSSELMTCEELHAILHLVLQAGNIMNAVSLSLSPAFFPFIVFLVFPIIYPSYVPFLWTFPPSSLFTFALSFQLFLSKTFPDIFKSGRVVGFYSIDQTLTDVLCVFIGWLCRQCFGLQTVLASLSG